MAGQYRNPLQEILSAVPAEDRPGIMLTREQLEAWAQRSLTDEQVEELADAIPNSSVPEAVATICDGFGYGDECECSESYRHRGEHTPGCPADDGERGPLDDDDDGPDPLLEFERKIEREGR